MVLKTQRWQNAQTAVLCIGTIMFVKNAVIIAAGRY